MNKMSNVPWDQAIHQLQGILYSQEHPVTHNTLKKLHSKLLGK